MPTNPAPEPPRRLSPEQLEAIEAENADQAVFAGAGSGKTTVLVERYLRWASKAGSGADAVPAITFTEKAAAEMKQRLESECARRGLDGLRRQIEHAPIGTIHGYCARLLKRYPIEAGIDPYFQVLTEGEAELLMDRALDAVFEEETGENWIALTAAHGEEAMRDLLKNAYALSRSHAEPAAPWRRSDRREERAALLREHLDDLEELERGICDDARATDAARRLAENLRLLRTEMAGAGADWPSVRRVSRAVQALELRVPAYKESVKQIKDRTARWLSLAAEELSAPLKNELRRVYASFRDGYDRLKRSSARLDFEDLLSITHGLLVSQEPSARALRRRLRDGIAQILVDEYQDTSPLQAAIVRCLGAGGKLFAVGDPQQSIYGFRNADPGVFADLVRGGAVRRTLADNYRSRPEILSFVNAVFSGMFPADTFQALVPRKSYAPAGDPCVEWLLVRPSAAGLDRARVTEARETADRILRLVRGKWAVRDGNGTRPCAWKDFAVLMRKSTAVHLYEKELAERGIPYRTVRGRGFFEKREITDLVCLLETLEDPYRDIPLAAVLRSPLVGLSDDGLLALAESAKVQGANAPLFEASRRKVDLPPDDQARWEGFLDWRGRLAASKDRSGLSRTLEEALRLTSYEEILLARPLGRQRAANVRKFLDLARGLEGSGAVGIGDFVGYVKALAEREVVEPEASLDDDPQDAVFVSTVHAAKGLEFPCVIVVDLSSKPGPRQGEPFTLSVRRGLGARVRDPEGDLVLPDATAEETARDAERSQREEEARLLYVAFTRAKERLILSGIEKEPSERKKDQEEEAQKEKPWLSRLADAAGVRWDSGDGLQQAAGTVVSVRVLDGEKPAGGAPGVIPEAPSGRIPASWDVPVAAGREYPETEDRSVTELLEVLSGGRAPDPDGPGDQREEPDADAAPGNEYGKVFHKVLEWLADDRPARVGASVWSSAPVRRLGSSDKARLEKEVTAFWSSPRAREIRKASRACPELPFLFRTRFGVLKGQIDLAYRRADGSWVLVDYKTNRSGEGEVAALAEAYRAQIGIYTYVFWRLRGERPSEAVLYFSDPAREAVWSFTEAELEEVGRRIERGFALLRAPSGQSS